MKYTVVKVRASDKVKIQNENAWGGGRSRNMESE